jgi:hypothetical protein
MPNLNIPVRRSVLVAATMAGLTVATLNGAGSANASCAAFSGIGNTSQCSTTSFGDVAIVVGNGVATAQGGFNVAWAIGNNAQALAVGKDNVAIANGNTGPNPGMVITTGDTGVAVPETANQNTFAQAIGVRNVAVALGDGSTATVWGGNPGTSPWPAVRRPQVGNNTAITIGNGSNSYAGALPPKIPPGNSPNNQFAAAVGHHRNAVNGINNK